MMPIQFDDCSCKLITPGVLAFNTFFFSEYYLCSAALCCLIIILISVVVVVPSMICWFTIIYENFSVW